MSAHTPGPWAAEPTNPHDGWDGWEVCGADGFRVCDAHGCQSNVVRAANARLIAAAPELLEVAEMVLGMATVDMPQELIDAAGIAVAKARREQP